MRLIRPNRPSRWSSKFSTFRNRSKCAVCHQRANQSSRACSQQRQEKFLAASEDQPATTHGSGSSSRLRNSTGLPSAYNPIAPELTDDPVTSFCSTPLTRTVTVLLRHTMSHWFHSSAGFSELGWRRGTAMEVAEVSSCTCEPPLQRISPALPDSNCASRHVGQTLSGGLMSRKTPLFPEPAGKRHSACNW